jgi:hypothetical protein
VAYEKGGFCGTTPSVSTEDEKILFEDIKNIRETF